MPASPRNLPRFLPTLTEVVQPPVVMQAPAEPSFPNEELIERVMRRLDVSLESRLREALDTRILEQLKAMEPRLRQEIGFVVRQAVAEAVAAELDTPKPD